MARKSKAQPPKQSLPKLRERASNALQQGNFREAIELHKQLLKRDPQAGFQEGLASAYLGRATELAAKGMYKEAAMLWENMAGSCGERQPGRYIQWLLLGGRLERAARWLQDSDPAFRNSPEGLRASTLLALQLLGQPDAVADALPADSPWWPQRQAMLSALQAYCAGDDNAMREALKQIPFRSPYRDLRTLLQALASRDTDPAAAAEQLARIQPDSPLAPLAHTLRDAASMDTTALLTLPVPLRELLMSLLGWDPVQRRALERLPTGDLHGPKSVLRFALGLEGVDEALLRRFCLAWLPGHPEGLASVERRFGPLSQAERACLKAQAGERKHDLDAIKRYWPGCAEALAAEQQPLGAALVFRHLAQLPADDPWDNQAQQYLQRSLELDPQDRQSYLELLKLADERGDLKTQHELTQQAATQFPGDVEIRLLAADRAHRRHAFKQAAEHARAALARDSLNTPARSMLLLAQIGLARQHVRQGRHDLAHAALDSIDAQVARQDRSTLALVRGLVYLGEKRRDEAHQHLQTAISAFGEGLPTRFRFLVQGRRMSMTQTALTRAYNQLSPPEREPALTPTALTELATLVGQLRPEGDDEVLDTLTQLQKSLKAATRLRLDAKQYQAWLDALFQVEHYGLLKHFASAAIKRFPGYPWFLFYEIFGRTEGDPENLDYRDRQRLHYAMDTAGQQEDHALLDSIEDLLDEGPPLLPSIFGNAGALPSSMPPEVRQALELAMDELGTDDPLEILEFLTELASKADNPLDLPPLPPLPRGRRR